MLDFVLRFWDVVFLSDVIFDGLLLNWRLFERGLLFFMLFLIDYGMLSICRHVKFGLNRHAVI
jgi:hypothetical protein